MCGTGNVVADFLLGYYTGAAAFTPGPASNLNSPGNLHHYVFNYFAPFVQDDWKVNNRLTVNLGLRWDWRNVPYEQNNDMFWIDDSERRWWALLRKQGVVDERNRSCGQRFLPVIAAAVTRPTVPKRHLLLDLVLHSGLSTTTKP